MKAFIKLFAAFVLAVTSSLSAYAEENVIKVGGLAWEDQLAISLTSAKFLEQQGFKVKFTKFSEWGIAFGALQKGDVDILLSNVDYMTSDYWSKYKNKLEKISIASFGVRQGLVVPSYMSIDSVEQLNTIADSVDGKIIGIEAGSGLMRETSEAVKKYNLKYTIIEGSTAAMVAQLRSSMERKEPVVVTLWEPSWMMQKFDVKFLEDPKHIFAPPQAYYWIANKGFSEKNSRARESLATVYLPIKDVTQIAAEMNNGKSVEQAVDAWWNTNQATVNKWSIMSAK